jgi:hypothetical protein
MFLFVNPERNKIDHLPIQIIHIIIWQGSLEVDLTILIGSFLLGILPYRPRPFPWKWS